MTSEEAKVVVEAIQQQYPDVKLGETDIANLAGKHDEDVDKFVGDLTSQYAQRAAPTASAGGRGGDADSNGDGMIDAGWNLGTGGQWTYSGQGGGPVAVGAGSGYLDYWHKRGVTDAQIFDPNGQLRPGWKHVQNGYAFTPPPGAPTAAPGISGGTASASLGGYGSGSTFNGGTAGRPSDGFMSLPQDLYDPWDKTYTRPTAQDLLSDPGYLARLDAQNRGLERGAAARGTLLTGGFQQRLGEYGQDYASNEYQKLADRSLGEYQTAFNNFTTDKTRRAGAYGLNFNMGQTSKMNDFSIFDTNRNFDFAQTTDARNFAANRDDTMFNRNRTTYLDNFGIWHQLDDDWWNRNFKLGEFGKPA